MRSILYEIFALGLMLGSGAFFYLCVDFLAEKDYVAGFAMLVIGFAVIRVGVELSQLAVLIRRDES